MVRLKGPLFGHDARGILAGILTYRRGGRAHSAYPYVKAKFPHTPAQIRHHALFSLLAARWGALPPPARTCWSDLARPHRLTNYNAYLSYHLTRLNSRVLDGLIGWWPNLCPIGDTLYDLSTSANPGTWFGPSDHWVDSPYGYASLYTPPNAYVQVGNLDIFKFTGDFTVAYHFQSVATANQVAVSKWTGLGSGSQWWIHVLSGKIRAGVYTPDPMVTIFQSNVPAGSGRWSHVALVRDGAVGHLYVDAVDTHTLPVGVGVCGQNAAPLTFGNFNGATGSWPYDGLLRDVRIYDRALSPGEVTSLSLH